MDSGGNITQLNNKVTSLGNRTHIINKLSDGAAIITKVGESPYTLWLPDRWRLSRLFDAVKAQSAYKYTGKRSGMQPTHAQPQRAGEFAGRH